MYYDIRFWRLSLRRTAFVFVLKLKVNTDLEQLLIMTCSYSKFRLLKRILCCCIVLPYLSSLRAPHNHIMFRSPMEIVAFTNRLKQHGKLLHFSTKKLTFVL